MGEEKQTKEKAPDDEKISISRKELSDLLAERDREAKMSDDEKRIRSIVRDETGRSLEEKLPKILSDLFTDDESAPGDEQEPGDTGKQKVSGIIEQFLGTGKSS